MMHRRAFLGATFGGLVLLPQAPVPPSAGSQADPLRIPEAAGRSRMPITDYNNDPIIKQTELQLKCTCGCNLDIFTCRTTDFTCTYSPELHLEIVEFFKQGMTPEEVIAAFVAKYGEQALMAPKAEGFNLAGYLVPGLATLAAATTLAVYLLRRRRQAVAVAAASGPAPDTGAVSPEEMERLRKALSEVAD
ncbi:MAG TPA: cytochrome c-type biogenesis protein CcmH [Gemmatimonadales bacterium]